MGAVLGRALARGDLQAASISHFLKKPSSGGGYVSTTRAYKSTVDQVGPQRRPRYGRPWPSRKGGCVNAQPRHVQGLFAAVQQQLGLAGKGDPGREVLNQNVGGTAQVGMLDVEGHLMR